MSQSLALSCVFAIVAAHTLTLASAPPKAWIPPSTSRRPAGSSGHLDQQERDAAGAAEGAGGQAVALRRRSARAEAACRSALQGTRL